MVDSFLFDPSTEEGVQFPFVFPDDWNNGTITYEVYWDGAATASGTAVWGVKGGSLDNDDAIDTALGSEVTVTDTLLAVGDLHISPTSSAVTIAGSPADGDYCIFQVVCKTSGTIAVDTKLMGIMIHWS